MKIKSYIFLVHVFAFAVSACSDNAHYNRVKIHRFDKDITLIVDSAYTELKDSLTNKYSLLLNIYHNGVLNKGGGNAPMDSILNGISAIYTNNNSFLELYNETESRFSDVSDIENDLSEVFGRYSEIFPGKVIPSVYSHVSGLGQSIITSDSLLSIALDNYLGEDYPAYNSVFYNYQLKDKSSQRIAPDVAKAWLYTQFPYKAGGGTLAEWMIYEGAILYAANKLFPAQDVFFLLNYDRSQIDWCNNNEKEIWSSIIRSNHLYSTDPLIYAKYINKAPYNIFFGNASPGEIGKWIGYKIVSEYIDNTGENQLLELLDKPFSTVEVLKKSSYSKP